MELRVANHDDKEEIMNIIEQARNHLKEANIDQWQQGYPDAAIIEEDIENKRGYILFDNDENIGYLCLDFGGDASYDEIEGKWLSEQPYAVIHRLAISDKARGKGKGVEAFSLAWNVCVQKKVFSLRVDTHEENMKMQHIIKKSGFVYCGIVYQLEGKRLAYEKLT